MVSEAHPQPRANENFLALQSQLEGTENRIAVERQRFNEDARDFNSTRASFPTVLFVNVFGDKFKEKPYFQAAPAAAQAPTAAGSARASSPDVGEAPMIAAAWLRTTSPPKFGGMHAGAGCSQSGPEPRSEGHPRPCAD